VGDGLHSLMPFDTDLPLGAKMQSVFWHMSCAGRNMDEPCGSLAPQEGLTPVKPSSKYDTQQTVVLCDLCAFA